MTLQGLSQESDGLPRRPPLPPVAVSPPSEPDVIIRLIPPLERRDSPEPRHRPVTDAARQNETTREKGFAAGIVQNAPPWLASAVVHMSALVLLGLLWLPTRADRQVHLEASTYAEELGDQLIFDSPLAGNDPDKVEEPLVTPDNLPEVDDPFAAPAKMEVLLEGSMATSDLAAPQIGLALRGAARE